MTALVEKVGGHMDDFRRFQRQRSLVSLRRAGVDENSIQGFVLGVSAELVLLQYVYDFRLDGLMILRIADISEINCSKTDQFQEGLLQVEGLLRSIPFDYSIDLSTWPTAIAGLGEDYPLLVLECELLDEPDLAIGRILEVGAEEVCVKYFTGAANWLEEPVLLEFSEITCCQVGTNYLNVYQRHFERNALAS
jgi:hypothetical protein